jgi:hypothetical protein
MSTETPLNARQQLTEQIGRIMHESWSKTKRARGYHGPHEPCTIPNIDCDTRRIDPPHGTRCWKFHYDLVDWNNLPEPQKDINRHAFDAVLESGVLVARDELETVRRAVLAEAERALWERAKELQVAADATDFNLDRDEALYLAGEANGLREAADLLAGMRGDK